MIVTLVARRYSCNGFTRWQLQMALHECLPLLSGGKLRKLRKGYSQDRLSSGGDADGEMQRSSSPEARQHILLMLLASELSASEISENILIRDANVHLCRDLSKLEDSLAYWAAMSQSRMRAGCVP